ncbi:MAG TPA: hypothetical protein VGH74_05210, partial [Planctomycetaceae bacterium]
ASLPRLTMTRRAARFGKTRRVDRRIVDRKIRVFRHYSVLNFSVLPFSVLQPIRGSESRHKIWGKKWIINCARRTAIRTTIFYPRFTAIPINMVYRRASSSKKVHYHRWLGDPTDERREL